MPVSHTIECTLREPSIVTNEETEQADVPQNEHPPVPQNEHPPVFLSYRKLRFHTIRNAPRGSHCSGMEECRLRDPPQAENPASQDSFLQKAHRKRGPFVCSCFPLLYRVKNTVRKDLMRQITRLLQRLYQVRSTD